MRPDREHDFSQYAQARIPRLHRVAFQLLGDRDRADDAVQNTLTVLYQRWTRMHDVQHLDAYVHTMLVRSCLSDHRRWWSKVQLRETTPDVPVAADDPLVDQRMMLRAALRRLPEGQRTVLVLRFLCDLPVAEVARLMNRSEGTVKRQTFSGLGNLRKLLDERARSEA
ncbi:SigE family RNA polymerase sigma factor [Dactylosporangium sp. NBC_01737]|uniref:SigE family RNA polymerase sigma factor n=1 Tax=Dactylosporangium sp. NBC_01737 TaxID=2975959 RepID=UPI002E0EDD71|nr:SigE family RNA polymerase sigma factor [Dactylosporangium sp. NBC_01737]